MLDKHLEQLEDIIDYLEFGDTDFKSGKTGKCQYSFIYMNEPFEFIIYEHPKSFDNFRIQYTYIEPGFHLSKIFPESNSEKYNEYGNLEFLKRSFKEWLSAIKRYLEDLYEPYMAGSVTEKLNNDIHYTDEIFTEPEKESIRLAIEVLKLNIETKYDLNEQHLKIVEDKLDYVIKAIDRLNKFDWKKVLLAVIMEIGKESLFSPQKIAQLFNMVNGAFSKFGLMIGM